MALVVLELRRRACIETVVCVTGQHGGMLDEALAAFDIRPDYDLAIMRPGQTLTDIRMEVFAPLTPLLAVLKPDRVVVHGDTTTTYAAVIASFYRGIPVGHVEAGVRTDNLMAPWPEEFNRRSVDLVADLLWAHTEAAAQNLRREGATAESIVVTGNTAVDAINSVRTRIETDNGFRETLWRKLPRLDPSKQLLLVAGHRRESFGEGLAEICRALSRIADRPDIEIIWPVHPNPNVCAAVSEHLKTHPNVHLVEPIEYLRFKVMMMRSHIIITDSGGIQEEAPTLAKPALVTRNETERPETVVAGTAMLVRPSADRIVAAAFTLLDDSEDHRRMTAHRNPFGDGNAAMRITDSIVASHSEAPAR